MTSYFTKSLVYHLGVPRPPYFHLTQDSRRETMLFFLVSHFFFTWPVSEEALAFSEISGSSHTWVEHSTQRQNSRGKEGKKFPWESVYTEGHNFESWFLGVDNKSLHLLWLWRNITLHFGECTKSCIWLDISITITIIIFFLLSHLNSRN